jgi:hypothetical protein
MERKSDLYGECNVVGAPVEVFAEQCCKHCINPECTRSAFGKTKFDQRVGNWYERMFSNVPRMNQEDPRFPKISAQRFLAINQPLTVNAGWIDPRDLVEETAPQIIEVSLPTPPIVIPSVKVVDGPPLVVTLEDVPPPAPPVESPRSRPQTLNTPVKPGQMIQPPAGQPKPGNSWDAPVPTMETQGVRVVKAGAKVKLGGAV